jgi:hypothetical protein
LKILNTQQNDQKIGQPFVIKSSRFQQRYIIFLPLCKSFTSKLGTSHLEPYLYNYQQATCNPYLRTGKNHCQGILKT